MKSITGPQTDVARAVHKEKYRGVNETFREATNRCASALQDSHAHYKAYREIQLAMRFLPGGRVQAAIGSLKMITAYNCFVMPTMHDSFTDGPTKAELDALSAHEHAPVSIAGMSVLAAKTMRQGGGVGYDFSTLRPSGDVIRGVQSTTDGPMAFAPIFNAICKATSSAGNRRGAQMLVMRVDHPDIEEFVRAKHCDDSVPYEYRPLNGFNMSVAITDEFMECLRTGDPFPLKFDGRVYREVNAETLWDMIMRSNFDFAEPGVIFIDRVNKMNNLWYCETIAATNPCGEQPLPPYGACLLGSICLPKYLIQEEPDGEFTFDYDQLEADLPHIIRSMDNVIDRTQYPLPEQQAEAISKRRMGIGVTGLANCIEAMGFGYGSKQFLQIESRILAFITRNCYLASIQLAREKGSFPLFDTEKYGKGEFIQTLDLDVQAGIAEFGIRNSHLTSLAPTGTISITADNVSSGVEPVLSYTQSRRIITMDGPIVAEIEDYGVHFLGVNGRRVTEITPEEHIKVLITAQRHVDSAVSKTCNVPTDISYDDFKGLYVMAYENGAKGCTTYRPNGAYADVISSMDDESQVCGFDPLTGQRTGSCVD